MFFDILLEKVNTKAEAIRQVIEKNNKLREFIFNEKIKERLAKSADLDELLKPSLSSTDWRVYEHCSVVTQLYSIYENFVEELIKDWLKNLPNIIKSYTELDDKIQ
ncbi:MAG: MAE_28990/MAE_18760 family HEPN-like nuclease, partial [Cyanobacteria bacterium P01_E01_bin.42]